jgi:uncharacterized protein YdhG (YjbR/CyaY superfamily)
MSLPDHYYEKHEEPNQSCLLALRKLILSSHPDVNEAIKWGIPCFMRGKRMFCFLSIHKKSGQPYILWSDGIHMEHPLLEQGDRKLMKVMMINPNEDLPVKEIEEILGIALELAKKKFQLKPKNP